MIITINTREWTDKLYGNTYFSADVFLGMDRIMSLPFQYGYGGARQEVENRLAKHFDSCAERWELRDLLRKNGIEISETKTKSLKRNLSKESFEDFTPFLKPENLALYAFYRMQNKIPVNAKGRGFFIESIVLPDKIVSKSYTPTQRCKFSDVNWF